MPNRPTPSALRKLSGSNLHRLNRNEARFAKLESLIPPTFLDDLGKEEFNRVGPELVRNGLLTKVSLMAFVAYCSSVSEMIHAENDVRENGLVLEQVLFNKEGVPIGTKRVKNPAVTVRNEARRQARNHMIEFGMTPASATGVKADVPDSSRASSFEDFLESPDVSEESDVDRLN